MNQLERVARAIAFALDEDTDEWKMWTIEAQAAIDAMEEWMPIETAPKDGSSILLATPTGRIADGFWGNYKVWYWTYVMVEPTHWMPLPEPPK